MSFQNHYLTGRQLELFYRVLVLIKQDPRMQRYKIARNACMNYDVCNRYLQHLINNGFLAKNIILTNNRTRKKVYGFFLTDRAEQYIKQYEEMVKTMMECDC